MIHCYEFYASPVILKPRYFELFFPFPWDFEIAGFNCSSSISSLVGVVADIVVVIITSTTTIVNLFLVLFHFLVNRLLMACGQQPGQTC